MRNDFNRAETELMLEMVYIHRDLMEKYANGASIEFKNGHGLWMDTEHPKWLPGVEYRVKPEPREYYLVIDENGTSLTSYAFNCLSNAQAALDRLGGASNNLRIITVMEKTS